MVKVISLSEQAYHDLKGLKHGSDSFSDVVLRLADKESGSSILDFAGIWKNHNEFDNIFTEIQKERKKFRTRSLSLQ